MNELLLSGRVLLDEQYGVNNNHHDMMMAPTTRDTTTAENSPDGSSGGGVSTVVVETTTTSRTLRSSSSSSSSFEQRLHDRKDRNPNILLAIVSSREEFPTRARTIMNTWGNPNNKKNRHGIPSGVTIRFFVGAAAAPTDIMVINHHNNVTSNITTTTATNVSSSHGRKRYDDRDKEEQELEKETSEDEGQLPIDYPYYPSGSPEDIAHLAELAGIQDHSLIFVMKDVPDNEYPPVRKNTAMIQYLDSICNNNNLKMNASDNSNSSRSQQQQRVPCDWMVKVDDDAYVHFHGLSNFLKKAAAAAATANTATRTGGGGDVDVDAFYGEPGTGRPEDRLGLIMGGLTGPFCMGGSGYVMSRSTLHKTSQGMKDCIAKVESDSSHKQFLWHSDTLIGYCVQEKVGIHCQAGTTTTNDDAGNDKKQHQVFRHCYNPATAATSDFLSDDQLQSVAVMHPFKDPIAMTTLHHRFQHVVWERRRRPASSWSTLVWRLWRRWINA